MARIFHHTIPIKGYLVLHGEGGKSYVEIVIAAAEKQAERQQENIQEWLLLAAGMLAAKPLEIINLQELCARGDQEIMLEQRD